MRLYELTGEIHDLVNDYDQEDAAVCERLTELYAALDAKLGACCRIYRNLVAEAEAIEDEEQRLRARRKSVERRAESLKNYIAYCLSVGQGWEDDLFRLAWRKSEAVVIDAPEQLIGIYVREKIIREPDKESIKRALKSGKPVPGARLESRLNLQIR